MAWHQLTEWASPWPDDPDLRVCFGRDDGRVMAVQHRQGSQIYRAGLSATHRSSGDWVTGLVSIHQYGQKFNLKVTQKLLYPVRQLRDQRSGAR
jgi:hypothetical protein